MKEEHINDELKDMKKAVKYRIDEITTYRRGSFPQPYGNPEWFDENGMPFVQVVDVGDNLLLKDKTKQTISKLAQEKSIFVPKGTVLVTLQGTIGKVAITQYDCYVDRTILIFEPNEKIDTYYFANQIQHKFAIEKEKAPGGIIKTITKEALSSFELFLPNIEEQQKLGKFLSLIDDLIEQSSNIEKLFLLKKKHYMQLIFSKNPEMTYKGFSVDLEEVVLEDIVTFRNGKGHEKFISDHGKYIVVNSKFISSNREVKKYSDNNLSPLYKDDLVMVMSDVPNGKAIAKFDLIDENDRYTLNQRIGAFSTSQNSKYLYYALNRNKYFLSFDDGAKQTNLKKDDILSFRFLLPTLEEQEKIATFLTSMDELISFEKKQQDLYKQMKKHHLNNIFK